MNPRPVTRRDRVCSMVGQVMAGRPSDESLIPPDTGGTVATTFQSFSQLDLVCTQTLYSQCLWLICFQGRINMVVTSVTLTGVNSLHLLHRLCCRQLKSSYMHLIVNSGLCRCTKLRVEFQTIFQFRDRRQLPERCHFLEGG